LVQRLRANTASSGSRAPYNVWEPEPGTPSKSVKTCTSKSPLLLIAAVDRCKKILHNLDILSSAHKTSPFLASIVSDLLDRDRSLQNFSLFGCTASPASVAFPSALRTQTNRAVLLFADVGPHFMRS
jgi:hypothetical protein